MKLTAFIVLALPLFSQEPIRYELRFPNAAHHEAEIRATFSNVRQPTLEVVMSRSSPGRYALHEFAKNVYNFRASDGEGQALSVARPTPYQWNISVTKEPSWWSTLFSATAPTVPTQALTSPMRT